MSQDSRTNIVVPTIGESVKTAQLGRWLKKVGEPVAAGEPVVSVDSDKASIEVPSPAAGVLLEVLAQDGDEVLIGATVGVIGQGAAQPAAAPVVAAPVVAAPERAATPSAKGPQSGPAARSAAAEHGVDISAVEGSGVRGRVLARDVEAAAQKAPSANTGVVPPHLLPVASAAPAPAAPVAGLVERVPMTPLRRTIARRLVEAQQTAAMLTTFNEVDMSRVMELRKKYQEKFEKKHGLKLGFMSFFVKAAIEALKAFPAVNAEIDDTDPDRPVVVYKRFYNVGVAVSTERGLVVPVVKGADAMSLAETEGAIAAFGKKARDGKLGPDDFKEGTFTISNGGVFGSLMSTPILNPPQVGILGMHAIQERPVGVDGQIVLRPMMYLALSYDHRIIDGREAVSFLVRIKELVEAPERLLLEV
jgi:2-oxoglutarate dehydrogenase E2 component (dihydrolipoamide succinyltransferase)